MKRLIVVLAVIAATVGMTGAPRTQAAVAGDETPFQFQLRQTESHRGVGVEGYVYNAGISTSPSPPRPRPIARAFTPSTR
jgi:hypothetical protein